MLCYRGPKRSNFLFSCNGDVRLLAWAKKRLSADPLTVTFYNNTHSVQRMLYGFTYISQLHILLASSAALSYFLSPSLSDMFPDLINLLSTNANSLPEEKGGLLCVCVCVSLVFLLLPWGKGRAAGVLLCLIIDSYTLWARVLSASTKSWLFLCFTSIWLLQLFYVSYYFGRVDFWCVGCSFLCLSAWHTSCGWQL